MGQADFELEQYQALRSEILRSMEDGNQVMAFGLAAIGLIVNAGIAARRITAGILIFSTFLPFLGALILSMWFAAQERTARASYFLSGAEIRIKDLVGMADTVSWEKWLRTLGKSGKSQHFWSTEVTAITLFFTIIAFSMGLSFAVGPSNVVLWERITIVLVSGVITGIILYGILRRFRRWRFWLSSTYDPDA